MAALSCSCNAFSVVDYERGSIEVSRKKFRKLVCRPARRCRLPKEQMAYFQTCESGWYVGCKREKAVGFQSCASTKFEGILRNAMILPDGALQDDAYYSIISSEWGPVKAALENRIRKKLSL